MVKKKKLKYKSLPFDICIEIAATKERFILKHVFAEMKVKDVKAQIELVVGIPSHLHRLQYLDEGDMLDDSTLRHNDMVAGGTLNLRLWRIWEDLVKAVCTSTFAELLRNGGLTVDETLKESNPYAYQHKLDIVKDRVSTAAFIAAHRGNQDMVKQLIQLGADLNYKTPFGRTSLHTAASQGHSLCIDLLLANGALMSEGDFEGKTPLNVANQFGFKDTERHLFLFQWQTRAAKTKPRKADRKLMMHQQFDSGYPIWLRGRHGQMYYATTLPPGEFGGTSLGAPRISNLSEGKVSQDLPPSPSLPRIDRIPQSQYETYPEDPWWQKGGASYDKFSRMGQASNVQEQELKRQPVGDGSRYSLGGAYINPKLAKQRERERVQSGKSMKSTSSKSSKSPKTFQEWVSEKETVKQRELMKLTEWRQQDEERRRQEEEQERLRMKTYDDWKRQKERKEKEEKERQHRVKVIEEKHRMQQKSEFSYDDWLAKKDEEILKEISAQ